MTPLKLCVVLTEQMETDNSVNVRISNRDEVSCRAHLVEIHETVCQSEQDVSVETMGVKNNRNGELWPMLVEQPIQLLARLNLGWPLAL